MSVEVSEPDHECCGRRGWRGGVDGKKMRECGKGVIVRAVVVDIEEKKEAMSSMKAHSCNVGRWDGDLGVHVRGNIRVD